MQRGLQVTLAGDLGQHHAGADTDRRADEQRLDEGDPQQHARPDAEAHGDRHLQRGADQHQPADLPQLGQAELEADAEHEQRHADIGETLDLFGVRDESRREWPHHQPRRDVADHRSHAQAVRDRAQDQGGAQGREEGDGEAAGHRVTAGGLPWPDDTGRACGYPWPLRHRRSTRRARASALISMRVEETAHGAVSLPCSRRAHGRNARGNHPAHADRGGGSPAAAARDPIIVTADRSLHRLAEQAVENPGCRVMSVIDGDARLIGLIPVRVLVNDIFLKIVPEEFLGEIQDVEAALKYAGHIRARTAGDIMLTAGLGPADGNGSRRVREDAPRQAEWPAGPGRGGQGRRLPRPAGAADGLGACNRPRAHCSSPDADAHDSDDRA